MVKLVRIVNAPDEKQIKGLPVHWRDCGPSVGDESSGLAHSWENHISRPLRHEPYSSSTGIILRPIDGGLSWAALSNKYQFPCGLSILCRIVPEVLSVCGVGAKDFRFLVVNSERRNLQTARGKIKPNPRSLLSVERVRTNFVGLGEKFSLPFRVETLLCQLADSEIHGISVFLQGVFHDGRLLPIDIGLCCSSYKYPEGQKQT